MAGLEPQWTPQVRKHERGTRSNEAKYTRLFHYASRGATRAPTMVDYLPAGWGRMRGGSARRAASAATRRSDPCCSWPGDYEEGRGDARDWAGYTGRATAHAAVCATVLAPPRVRVPLASLRPTASVVEGATGATAGRLHAKAITAEHRDSRGSPVTPRLCLIPRPARGGLAVPHTALDTHDLIHNGQTSQLTKEEEENSRPPADRQAPSALPVGGDDAGLAIQPPSGVVMGPP